MEKSAERIVEKIKELVKKGNVTRIIIEKNDQTIVNLPLNAGVIAIAIAPWPMIIATLVTLGTDCKIKVETKDNNIINIIDDTTDNNQNK